MKELGLRILAVDDEEFNLDIMGEYFEEANFNVSFARDGIDALEILKYDQNFDVIVLDRMMPRMDGMEFLKKIKQVKSCKDIPVIMQTAASSAEQVAEGVKSGVYYYLSKPYAKDVFLAIIRAASSDHKAKQAAREQLGQFSKAVSFLEHAKFHFKTPEEAKLISALVGSALPEPEKMIIGLTELTVNAVEHGNLGITYAEKVALKLSEQWEAEINKRLAIPTNANKTAILEITKQNNNLKIIVSDEGAGFEWQKFMKFDPARLMDPSGRGIMMLMNSGFKEVKYLGSGNIVELHCSA